MFDKMKTKWREKHPMNPYDAEEQKLHECLAKLEAGTPAYAQAQAQLKEANLMRKEHYESKRRFVTLQDRGGIIKKLLGGAITIGGVCLLSKYEADGNTFTGEKRKFADSFVRVLGGFFHGGD